MTPNTRDGCCADLRKPCRYHEGWEDAIDAACVAIANDSWEYLDDEMSSAQHETAKAAKAAVYALRGRGRRE